MPLEGISLFLLGIVVGLSAAAAIFIAMVVLPSLRDLRDDLSDLAEAMRYVAGQLPDEHEKREE